MLPLHNDDKEINLKQTQELYKTKREFLNERNKTVKKVFSKGPEFERRLKMINLNFNPSKYKCKLYY